MHVLQKAVALLGGCGVRGADGQEAKEERTSFLQKRSKRPLIILASASPDKPGPDLQKFFGAFFQKTALPSFHLTLKTKYWFELQEQAHPPPDAQDRKD
jgi:hypothetical protein